MKRSPNALALDRLFLVYATAAALIWWSVVAIELWKAFR